MSREEELKDRPHINKPELKELNIFDADQKHRTATMRSRSYSITPRMYHGPAVSTPETRARAKSMMNPATSPLLPLEPPGNSESSKVGMAKMKTVSSDDIFQSETKVIELPVDTQIETSYPKFLRDCLPELPVSPTDVTLDTQPRKLVADTATNPSNDKAF